MMKKMMMIAAMMVATLTASAQRSVIEPGQFGLQPKVGLNLSQITSDDTKFKAGLAAGFEGQYQVNNWFALTLGVMYEQQGTAVKITDAMRSLGLEKAKANLEYLNIPVMARFYVAKGLSLGVGLQPGFLTKAKQSVEGQGWNVDNDGDIKDACNKFCLAVPVSISYELPFGLTFDARYTMGVNDTAKEDKNGNTGNSWNSYYDGKNSVIQLTVGYKFGF